MNVQTAIIALAASARVDQIIDDLFRHVYRIEFAEIIQMTRANRQIYYRRIRNRDVEEAHRPITVGSVVWAKYNEFQPWPAYVNAVNRQGVRLIWFGKKNVFIKKLRNANYVYLYTCKYYCW